MGQEERGSRKLTVIVALVGLGGIIIGLICGVLKGPAAVEMVKDVLYGAPTVIAVDSTPTPTFTWTPTATSIETPSATPTPHKPPTKTPTPTNTSISTNTLEPTPISEHDAVVNAENMNLRSGPDDVYDVLEFLERGDPLKIKGKCPDGNWLKVVSPSGQEGWVAAWLLQINMPLAEVAIAQVPPTPTPMYTLTPTTTPTPELFPPPTLLEPENGASFAGWRTFKWQLAVEHSLQANEYFSFRVYEKGDGELCHREEVEELCHHIPLRALEYTGGLSYCPGGDLCWGVTLVRKLCEVCPEEQMWQILSQPSEDRLIHYQPVDETEPPEPWPKEPPKEQPPKEPSK